MSTYFETDIKIDATIQTTWEWAPTPPTPPTPTPTPIMGGFGRIIRRREKELEEEKEIWLLGDLIIEGRKLYYLYCNLLRYNTLVTKLSGNLAQYQIQHCALTSDLDAYESVKLELMSKLSISTQRNVRLSADLAQYGAVQLQAFSVPLTDYERKTLKKLQQLEEQLKLALLYMTLDNKDE